MNAKLKKLGLSDAGIRRIARRSQGQEQDIPQHLITEVAAALDYNIYAVADFVVQLLFDVNAGPEARAVGDVLADMLNG